MRPITFVLLVPWAAAGAVPAAALAAPPASRAAAPSPAGRAAPSPLAGAPASSQLAGLPVSATPTGRAAPSRPTAASVVRLTVVAAGRGLHAPISTRVDVFDARGVRRRVRTVPGGGYAPRPVLSPDGTRVAFGRPDGSIAVVALRSGALRLLSPPDLPRRWTPGEADRDRWVPVDGASLDWSSDGRTVVAHGLTGREPASWAGTIGEQRSISCVVATGRCSSAGAGAPADLLPLPGGTTLRLDAPVAREPAEDGDVSLGLDHGQQRTVLAGARRRVAAVASLLRPAPGGARTRVLASSSGSGRTGFVATAGTATGPAGALVLRTSVRFGPDTNPARTEDEDSVTRRTRVLRPWVVSPAGRLSTLPIRLAVAPVGALADGRWILPTPEAAAADSPNSSDEPEPGLATLDRRGRVRLLRVGGRPVTPVGLALAAGLPDDFATGARFDAVRAVGGDLLIELSYSGSDGTFFFPSDGALLRLPLDGASPARIVDHEGGASYVVR